jgi:FMN phosphatase YigB (HAD superfamily)
MSRNQIHAVLFDWDGTLASVFGSAPTNHRIAAQMNRLGLVYSPDDVQASIQARQSYVNTGKWRGKLKLRTRRDIIRFYQQLLFILGYHDPSWGFATRLYAEFGRLPFTLYDDSLPTLGQLRQRGLGLGIISNISASTRGSIEKHIGDFVESGKIIISEELGVHKPAKTIFMRAASRLRTPPQNCLYVGDDLEVDAIGSVQNGGYGIGLWIDRKGMTAQVVPKGVARIDSLQQIIDFV